MILCSISYMERKINEIVLLITKSKRKFRNVYSETLSFEHNYHPGNVIVRPAHKMIHLQLSHSGKNCFVPFCLSTDSFPSYRLCYHFLHFPLSLFNPLFFPLPPFLFLSLSSPSHPSLPLMLHFPWMEIYLCGKAN